MLPGRWWVDRRQENDEGQKPRDGFGDPQPRRGRHRGEHEFLPQDSAQELARFFDPTIAIRVRDREPRHWNGIKFMWPKITIT